MPKCQVCNKLYHPDYVVVVDSVTDAKGDSKDLCKCVFCKTLKDEVTLKKRGDGGQILSKVTKEEANSNYLRHLKELASDDKIAKLLVGDGGKP